MIEGPTFFDQSVKNYLRTYNNIRKNAMVKEMIMLLVVSWIIKMIVVDLSKQQALHADPKAIQLINFTENLGEQATMFFITEVAKETI